MNVINLAEKVKEASLKLATLDSDTKNKALKSIAKALVQRKDEIIFANKKDLTKSEKECLASPLLKRLKFDEAKIADVVSGIESLISLKDPVGETLLSTQLDTGLELYKLTCPIGVIGIIFESRPDALVQISTLCLKSGNGVLLKGGSEAMETNKILTDIIVRASADEGVPPDWAALLETREAVNDMLKLDNYIDLIIPRGSNEFVKYIMDNSKIPVMGHADGICHCYVDDKADINIAIKVVIDSKTQYVAVCNAAETLLVHEDIANKFLPLIEKKLSEKNVELVGCEKACEIINIKPATEKDWKTEYLDYKLSIKIVESLEHAISHINKYGSGHTDAIITSDANKASKFMSLVDSGNVFWNCSTRFSDGFRYGFGAEVGISTNKLHARGPVGLEGLLSYKYKLIGNGHTVEEYSNKTKVFAHKAINKKFPL